jgi:hypothetical protein
LHELAPIVSRIAAICIVGGFTTFDLFDANSTPLWYQKGLLAGVAQMRIVKSLFPVAVSLGLVAAVTAILWQINFAMAALLAKWGCKPAK